MAKNANPFADYDFTANPFAKYDFTKMWSEFKLPQIDVEAIMAAQQRNIDAVSTANKAAIEGFQVAARRQFDLVRETMEKGAEITQEYVALNPEEKLAKQGEYAKAAFETGLDNAREVTGIVTGAANEAAEVVNKRILEGFGEWEDFVAHTANGANGSANGAPKAKADTPKPAK